MKTKCPYCNYEATEHETLDKEKYPQEGEISFCINCGDISKFKNCSLVKVDSNSLDEEAKEELNDIRIAWLRRKAIVAIEQNE